MRGKRSTIKEEKATIEPKEEEYIGGPRAPSESARQQAGRPDHEGAKVEDDRDGVQEALEERDEAMGQSSPFHSYSGCLY